jgi:hypothetical protein
MTKIQALTFVELRYVCRKKMLSTSHKSKILTMTLKKNVLPTIPSLIFGGLQLQETPKLFLSEGYEYRYGWNVLKTHIDSPTAKKHNSIPTIIREQVYEEQLHGGWYHSCYHSDHSKGKS